MLDYFEDANIGDFNNSRLQETFDSGKQWSEYLDDYIADHFNDNFDYSDEYWDDYFHQKRFDRTSKLFFNLPIETQTIGSLLTNSLGIEICPYSTTNLSSTK